MFDNIIIFTYLVEQNSFSKTAELLRSTQSTISKKIIELENFLNERLVIRNNKKLELTHAGSILYEKFKSLRQDLQSSISDMKLDYEEPVTELTVVLPTSLAYELICPYFNSFVAKHPTVVLNLIFTAEDPINLPCEFDLALTQNYTPSNNYFAKEVRREIMQLYCTPLYVTNYGIPRSIEELEKHYMIGGLDIRSFRPIEFITFVNRYTGEHIALNNAKMSNIRTNFPTHIKRIGDASFAIFPCWNFLCEQDVCSGKLIPVLPEYGVFHHSFHLLYKSHNNRVIQDLSDFIYKCVTRDPPIFI